MFENFTLSDVKGAPLSILVFLSINGNRAVSVSDLAGKAGTGFSDKPVKEGLIRLKELGVICEPRKNRYQLTGKEYQLPLYWGEKVLPFGDSPRISGDSPNYSGVSPDLERRVEALEAAVFRGLPASEAGDSPIFSGDSPDEDGDSPMKGQSPYEYSGSFAEKFGVSPNDAGDFPMVEIEGQWKDDGGCEYSGNFPEKFGDSPVQCGDSPIKGQSPISESGDSPEKAGVFPEKSGESPNSVNPLINNINNKEVSKYVEKDTYLLNGNNTESELINPTEKIADAAGKTPDDYVTRWNATMAQMKGSMDRQTFSTFLGKAVILGYEEGHYTIGVENGFICDWLQDRLLTPIEKILNVMGDRKQSVSFVVTGTWQPADQCDGCGGDSSLRLNAEPAEAVPVKHLECHRQIHKMLREEADRLEWERSHLPKSGDAAEDVLVDICNEYLDHPKEQKYSMDQLAELVAIQPDPRVLRFALESLSSFKAVKVWCGWAHGEAKKKLLSHYGIRSNPNLESDKTVSLEIIRDVCEELDPEEKKYAISRIWMMAKGNVPM